MDAIDAAGYRERILGRETCPAEQILSETICGDTSSKRILMKKKKKKEENIGYIASVKFQSIIPQRRPRRRDRL